MIGFAIRILGNGLALYGASYAIPGFILSGGIKEYALAGVLLGLLNATVRPFLKLVSMPIIILSLGIFSLIISAGMLWLVDYIFDFVKIKDLYSLVLATIVISIVNTIVSSVTKLVD